MEIKDFIMIAGFMITILTIFFSRKDRDDDRLEKVAEDIKKEFKDDFDDIKKELKDDIKTIFIEIDKKQSKEMCMVYHTAHEREHEVVEKNINNLGDMIRGK